MVTDSLAPPKEKHGDKPCRCGCAPCDDPCCRLECIVQPRFYCGQLLTDDDLQALVGWASAKFKLARYRHGWGVVCGLDVRADPKRPTGVIIGPGYAIDCCGNDIIVCEDYRYDLYKYCPDDRCGEPGPRDEGGYGGGDPKGGGKGRRPGGYDDKRDDVMVDYRSYVDRLMSEAVPIDLSIAYDEQGIEPKVALGKCGCGSTGKCEHSRTKEGFRLIVTKVGDPAAQESKAEEELAGALDRFAAFAADLSTRHADVRRRLLEWIEEHPLGELTFISRQIAQATDNDLATEKNLSALLYWLLLDYRNNLIRCRCYECERETGVPLARLWLDAGDRAAGIRCQIVGIDPRPPYRRPLSPVYCRPVPRNCIDLTSVIWTDPVLARQQIPSIAGVSERGISIPTSYEELRGAIACARIIKLCAEPLDMQVIDAGPMLGKRIAGFCPTQAVKEPKGGGGRKEQGA